MHLVHSITPSEEVTVLFNGEVPIELYIEQPNEMLTDTICVARASKALKESWFVDIGGKSGFLPTPTVYCKPDGTTTDAPLTEGDALLVQVQRPAFENKEAKVSAQINLVSELLIYTPMKQGISFSRQLSEETKLELENTLANETVSPTESFMVRTAAEEATTETIVQALQHQRALWEKIIEKAKEFAGHKARGIIYLPPKSVFHLAEQYRSVITEAVTDNSGTIIKLKKIIPTATLSPDSLMDKEEIMAAIEEALDTFSHLPSGGSLITEQTAACVCFDVNSGPSNWNTANAEACDEILRQIKLKGLSGQMVIDFAGRKEKGSIQRLADRIQAGNRSLRVWGVSNLGLVEITAERTRRTIWEIYPNE